MADGAGEVLVVDAASVAHVANHQPLGDRLDFFCHYVPTSYVGT
jgi:hypothetical protein